MAHARNALSGYSFHYLSSGELHGTYSAVPQPFYQYGMAYSSEDLAQSHPILLTSLHGGKGSSFPCCVPPNDMVDSESVVGIKPGDSGVMIEYWIVEFTQAWLAECYIVQSHIYHGFMDKVSTQIHFPLELGYEDYSYLDQAIEDFEHGLHSILTDFIDIPELDASFEADSMPSSFSSGFLHLINTHSDNFTCTIGR